MPDSSPVAHRHARQVQKNMQQGTIVSFTTVRHPPAGFPVQPRVIALITLDDASMILAPITSGAPMIGARVFPRMQLSRINENHLRLYDIAFEVLTPKSVPLDVSFPGYLLALTGPSGVGKTTISRQLVSMFATHTENVPILTTRKPKKGDDGEYKYISKKEFEIMRARGEIVAAVDLPSRSEERSYGYLATDIEAIWHKGMLPVVITEMHLLESLAMHYGRRSILSFGLLPPGRSKRAMLSALLHRLRTRGRETEEAMQDRLQNAERDLAFFKEREDLFDHLITNDNLDSVMALFQQKVPSLQEA